jgi:hypothetical protein
VASYNLQVSPQSTNTKTSVSQEQKVERRGICVRRESSEAVRAARSRIRRPLNSGEQTTVLR